MRRFELVQPVAVSPHGLCTRLVDHHSSARTGAETARRQICSPGISQQASKRRQHLPAASRTETFYMTIGNGLNVLNDWNDLNRGPRLAFVQKVQTVQVVQNV